jgi:hypothetical protein
VRDQGEPCLELDPVRVLQRDESRVTEVADRSVIDSDRVEMADPSFEFLGVSHFEGDTV